MTTRVAAQDTQIRWEWAAAGEEGNSADTHCCICLAAEDASSILAHPIPTNGKIGRLVDRVHRACLLEAAGNRCPICRQSYNRSEVPVRTIDRITDMLSEGRKLGKRIAINFSTYAIGGSFFTVCLLVEPIIDNLIEEGFSSALGLATGGVIGACMGATALSLVGDVSLYAGRRVIEWTHVQNPTLRKILFVCTAAIAAIASIYAATLLYSALEACIISRLAPEAQAVYSYLIGNGVSYPSDIPTGIWNAARDAALLAYDRMEGVVIGNMFAFIAAFMVKHVLFCSETHLDDTIFSI